MGGRSPRARRGDIRAAALLLLSEQPMNGYQLIQEIKARSDGAWKPSSGSMYPTLDMLQDEGLIRATGGKGKPLELLDEGRTWVEDHKDEAPPWEAFGAASETFGELKAAFFQLGAAGMQVAGTGTESQIARALDILVDARKQMYSLLAEDE
jgi:DNA-binding PadR family transcriptional regulator